MEKIAFPENIKLVLSSLESAGFEAYAVGGCIRDSILGIAPQDWDVTTSARPEETMRVFGENAVPTGLKHGTITVKTPPDAVEVTTFRKDGSYSDHRRPDSVTFVGSLREDLARRDFTMNAIASPLSGELIDPFGGRKDIENGVIRCVGEPDRRFAEDALRMFRALRFSSRLGFEIEKETLDAIYGRAQEAAGLAPERIMSELSLMIVCDNVEPVETAFDSGLMDRYVYPGRRIQLSRLRLIPGERLPRLSGLCAVLARDRRADPEGFLTRLRFDLKTVKTVSAAVGAAMAGLPHTKGGWKRLICSSGIGTARCALASSSALGHEYDDAALNAIITSGECMSLAELKIGGSELGRLGFEGRAIGSELNRLLERVFDEPELNDREKLLDMAYEDKLNLR